MKITKVDVMKVNLEERKEWRPIICRIYTDEGIYGDGEAAMAYGEGATGAFGMLQDLSKLIINMDPMDHEVIWDKFFKSTFWAQNGGSVVYSAMSAIDIALWDIKGKALNMPIYKLLGGKRRDKLRTYASQLQFGWSDHIERLQSTEEYVEVAKKAVAEGFDAVKYDFFTFDRPGAGVAAGGDAYIYQGRFTSDDYTGLLKPYYLDLIEERVAAVREAVGPSVDIIVENHSRTDSNSAIQIAQRIEKYNIFLFEEPNTPTPKMTRFVRDNINIPVSQGERVYTRWQWVPYFESNAVQLIQPDIGNTGGITETKKICDMAQVYDIAVQCHVCASPLSVAAALHVEAVIPNFCIHEHHVFNRHPYNTRLCVKDLQPVNGKFDIPEGPGLGNEFSEFALTRCDKVTIK